MIRVYTDGRQLELSQPPVLTVEMAAFGINGDRPPLSKTHLLIYKSKYLSAGNNN